MPLFPIWDGRRYGYADEIGAVVIATRFTKIPIGLESRFYEGLAVACDGAKLGYIDARGEPVLPAIWDGAGRFSEGRAAVATRRRGRLAWRYIDRSGDPVGGEWFKATAFSAGRAFVEREPGSGFELVDPDGRAVGDARFAGSNSDKDLTWKALAFEAGLGAACDRLSGRWGFVDPGGRWVLPPIWKAVRSFADGLACVQDPADGVAFVDREGREVLRYPIPYLALGGSSEGLVAMPDPVDSLSKAYFRHDGSMAIPARREHGAAFSNGRALYRLSSGYCGFIDPSGAFAIDPQYVSAEPFADGLARVVPDAKKPGRFGYIDTFGRMVIPPDVAAA
jgi:hypothetical protein